VDPIGGRIEHHEAVLDLVDVESGRGSGTVGSHGQFLRFSSGCSGGVVDVSR
jgi:hypothetical protein